MAKNIKNGRILTYNEFIDLTSQRAKTLSPDLTATRKSIQRLFQKSKAL